MTSVFHRPTAVGGSPEPGDSPDQRSREATNRVIANQTNAMVLHHRRNMASHEALSEQVNSCQQRTDVGVGEILKMQMLSEDARKDDRKESISNQRKIIELLEILVNAHARSDFIVVSKEEQFTLDPDEEI